MSSDKSCVLEFPDRSGDAGGSSAVNKNGSPDAGSFDPLGASMWVGAGRQSGPHGGLLAAAGGAHPNRASTSSQRWQLPGQILIPAGQPKLAPWPANTPSISDWV